MLLLKPTWPAPTWCQEKVCWNNADHLSISCFYSTPAVHGWTWRRDCKHHCRHVQRLPNDGPHRWVSKLLGGRRSKWPLLSGAARAGVENLTRSLAVEWAEEGVQMIFALRFLWIKTRRGYPLLLQLSPHHYESFLRWGWIALPLAPPSTPPRRRPTMETPLLLLRLQDQVFLQSGWEPPWRLD